MARAATATTTRDTRPHTTIVRCMLYLRHCVFRPPKRAVLPLALVGFFGLLWSRTYVFYTAL
jgi:hypothetical protein